MKLIQIIVFSLFILFFIGISSANPDWTISGNTVYVDTTDAYISVTPHTLHNPGYVYLNITSKSFTGNIDLAFLFNEAYGVKPLSGEIKNGGGWYVSIVSAFNKNSINYDGFDTAYLGTNLPVTAGTTYQLRVYVDIPPEKLNIKYGVALKPSAKTISESIAQGYFYYLDPWVNTTGGDHQNQNWTVSNGDIISGTHYNINVFTIESGSTVSITPLSELEIYANKIYINGTINGDGAGYAGGINGATGTGTGHGGPGTAAVRAGGGAGYGGVGGAGEFYPGDGSGHPGITYGSETSHTIEMGSGGGGGDALGDGGTGGGSLALYSGYIYISGTITLNGTDGNIQGGDGGGGAGSGGGLLLEGYVVNFTSTAKIYANGGLGGHAFTQGGDGGGGRIKIFYREYNNTGTVEYYKGGSFGYLTLDPANGTFHTLQDTTNYTESDNNGYVYYTDDTPINGATVLFYNDSWSASTTTNSLGYWSLPTMTKTGLYFYNVSVANRGFNNSYAYINTSSSNTTDIIVGFETVYLLSPANTSTISTSFPPVAYSVSFLWDDTTAAYYRIEIAEDSVFNIVVVDTVVSTNSTSQNLLVNDEYYWRIYPYDGSIYGPVSETYQFNITGTSSATGSAIDGVVYGSGYAPIANAEVSIWNATWSDSDTTSSTGYYVFEGLTVGQVYSLQARADRYYTSSVAIVSAAATPTTRNFYLLDDLTDTEWWHYVKFTTQSIWGTKYQNVDTTVYLSGSVTPYLTGTTGSDGSVTFHLNQHVQYRITFTNATQGISETRTIYPKDNHYIIIISETFTGWDTYTVPISDAIDFSISKSEINATHAYINFTYSDTLSQTTALKVYLNQTNGSDYINQTAIDSYSGAGNTTHSFIIQNYVGQSYIVHLVATHTTYGTIDTMYSVSFKGEIADKFPGIPPSVWLYASIFILIFTGGIFVNSNVEKGMLITCIMFFVLYGLGGFGSLPSAVQTSMLAGGILGFILSIIANLNKSNKEEGYS